MGRPEDTATESIETSADAFSEASTNGRVATVTVAPPVARARDHVLHFVPWFLIEFILVATMNSIGLIPAGARAGLSTTSVFLITVALSAIGLSTDRAGFRRAGHEPLVLGTSLCIVVPLTRLGLRFATGLK